MLPHYDADFEINLLQTNTKNKITLRPARALPFLKYPFAQSFARDIAFSASFNALKMLQNLI